MVSEEVVVCEMEGRSCRHEGLDWQIERGQFVGSLGAV